MASVHLEGEIDMANVGEVRRTLQAAVEANPGEVVLVDLAGVTFIDSTGLGALISAHKAAQATGGSIQVVNEPPTITRLLEITGLERVFGRKATT